jgi:hypothetical protein
MELGDGRCLYGSTYWRLLSSQMIYAPAAAAAAAARISDSGETHCELIAAAGAGLVGMIPH